MIQWPHGVEGVGGMASARSDTGASRYQLSVRVAQAHTNSTLYRFGDDLYSTRQFGCDGQHANVTARGLPKAVKRGKRGRHQVFRWMHAAAAMADERTFEMNPPRSRPNPGCPRAG